MPFVFSLRRIEEYEEYGDMGYAVGADLHCPRGRIFERYPITRTPTNIYLPVNQLINKLRSVSDENVAGQAYKFVIILTHRYTEI